MDKKDRANMVERKTVGEVLIDLLEAYDVDTVFGIPGVHTVELYRGLSSSNIRHITPRHESSAGFMADGYARIAGKPGVCLLITGPGLTNAITAMGQARADSVPMLIISGVNKTVNQAHEDGHLHELPDQVGLMRSVALYSHCLQTGVDLPRVLARAFAAMTSGRPGPVHLEIPLNVMSQMIDVPELRAIRPAAQAPNPDALNHAVVLCQKAKTPVLVIGGGALSAEPEIIALAERLDAPVVTTVNARGMLAGHALRVPASPSLPQVRRLLAEADLVIAIGTQLGPTDYDMYIDGAFPKLQHLLRIDVDPLQMTRGILADSTLVADAALAVDEINARLKGEPKSAQGAVRAAATSAAAFDGLIDAYKDGARLIAAIGQALPGCIMVGDSTQLVYAGNSYAEISRNRGWFNSATGYGTLGYGPPAAIGAQLASPDVPVICITGDGGFQFCLSELGTAMDEGTPVIFLVWNNSGYGEIESYMVDNNIATIGVTPSPPDFVAVAAAYGMAGERLTNADDIPAALAKAHAEGAPYLIELVTPV
ncbi:MAG: 5-guanidino-2-oxopentanoate decarboxylase [Octadecabacter sp.]